MKLLLPLVLTLSIGSEPPIERIEMTIQSWGRPMSQWSIDARGEGTYTRPEPGVFDAKRLATYRIGAGREGFAKLRGLLEDAKLYAGRKLPCTQRITDAPYGTVRWVFDKTAELRFDSGCQDPETRIVLARLRDADDQVAAWGIKAPAIMIDELERE